MKKILLVCGSGIYTSRALSQRVKKALDDRGLEGTYEITLGKASDAAEESQDFDLCITTTTLDGECACPVVIGASFLLGRDVWQTVDQIVEILNGEDGSEDTEEPEGTDGPEDADGAEEPHE